VLEEDRVAALGRIEEAHAEEALEHDEISEIASTGVASSCTQPVA